MKTKGKIREWLWLILPAVFLLGIGVYFVSDMMKDSEETSAEDRVSPALENGPSENESELSYEEEETVSPPQVEPPPVPLPEESPYISPENYVAEFFRDLDQKHYIRKLDATLDTRLWFENIMRRVSLNPPASAGEERNPNKMFRNICYFYRVLGLKDIQMISTIIENEKQSMELDMRMFYRCISNEGECPEFKSLIPSKDVTYQLAGFFLNTIGGRAYLFRRSIPLRLLGSYYCVLIIYDADKNGQNIYGIDVFPHLKQLKQEIIRYPEFQFQQEYIRQLEMMESEYIKKR